MQKNRREQKKTSHRSSAYYLRIICLFPKEITSISKRKTTHSGVGNKKPNNDRISLRILLKRCCLCPGFNGSIIIITYTRPLFSPMRSTASLLALPFARGIGISSAGDVIDHLALRANQANDNDHRSLRGRTGTNFFDDTPARTSGGYDAMPMTMNDSKNMSSRHVGCDKLLKANHTAQDLEAVNFRANDSGDEMTLERDVDADSFMAVTAQQAAIPCVGNFSDTGSVQYPCWNIDLMSFIPLASFIIPGVTSSPGGNNVWGWTYGNGREFALMGLSTGTAFVEITDPVNPVYIGILPAHNLAYSTWRDVRTYANHAFIVSEATSHGMQVFDLTLLLNVIASSMPVRFSATARYTGFSTAHTIAINEATGMAYAVGTNTYAGGLHMVNITNPTNPVLAGGYGGDGYTHECECILCEYRISSWSSFYCD
jgi:hypothetical protein